MEKRFFIWKDPGCAGVNVEWLELTGTEFHALLERPENKSRRFIRLGSGMDLDLDMIYLEVTETQYRDWAKEHNARKYRSRRDRDFSILSMDFSARDADVSSLHDVVPDDETDVENTALSHLAHEKVGEGVEGTPCERRQTTGGILLYGERCRRNRTRARRQPIHCFQADFQATGKAAKIFLIFCATIENLLTNRGVRGTSAP